LVSSFLLPLPHSFVPRCEVRMFEFIRDSLLCSADEQEKVPMTTGRRTVCCTTGATQSRRRPAEVISSQGAPVHAKNEVPSPLPWDSSSRKRETTPLRNRSPVQSFRSTGSFALGNSMACTGAALAQEDNMPGRGLYISMQGGLGPRDRQNKDRRERRSDASPQTPLQQRRTSSRTNVRVMPVCQAANYEAFPEDSLDVMVQDVARRLPQNGARALLLRRLSRGEYEVDGARVSINIRGSEAYVYPTNDDGNGKPETLSSYLLRAADSALARSMSTASFNASHDMRMLSLPPPPPMPGSNWNGNAGVLVRGPDGGSFLLGSSFYSQASGVTDHAHQRVEALHLMSQMQSNSRRSGLYGQGSRNGYPAAGPPPPPIQPAKHGGYPGPSQQAPYGFYAQPSFIAVNG